MEESFGLAATESSVAKQQEAQIKLVLVICQRLGDSFSLADFTDFTDLNYHLNGG